MQHFMQIDPAKLIQFIVCQATEFGASLSPIRVVKFLYLADLYHARENKGETLTGWPWKFVYFGPYCTESFLALKRAVDDGLIEAKPFESKYDDKDRFLYSCPSEEGADFESQLSIYVWSSLKEAIKKWADDTPGLLDHVYYDTEPMEDVKRGDLLDFSKAHLPIDLPKLEMKKISRSKTEKAKQLISALREQYRASSYKLSEEKVLLVRDGAFRKSLPLVDDEDLEEGLSGVAKIGNVESE
jgi:hypothetical protein